MSKEIDMQQILLQEDSHANHSALQEREKEQTMTATSGMKLLESSESVNLDGSLGKMLKALLTSKKAWSSDRCVMTWKKKVSKSNVLLFQLQASVRGIKGKESGFLPTPNTMDHIDRKGMRPSRAATNRKSGYLSEMIKMYPTPTQDSASERTKKYKQGGTPLPLAVKMYPTPVVSDHLHNPSEEIENWKKRAEKKKKQGINLHFALRHHVQMYPTPRASDIEGGAAKNVQMKDGRFFRENKKGERWGVKLRDAMEMMPTPTARDHKDMGYQPTWKPSRDKSVPRTVLKDNKPGGKLNPTFVEMLMAYPMNWTKIEPTE